MTDKRSDSTAPDIRFEDVLAGLLQAEERGERLDVSQVVRKFPGLEAPLREFFRNRDGFDRLAPQLAPVPARPDAPPSPPHLSPGSLFGDYEILGELGRGGMGVVYKARQRSLKRLVALKMILAGELAGPDQVKRFHREARALAELEHPNIVPIYEVGEHNGQHYFSMKLIEGSSLSRELAHYRRNHKAAAFLVARVARAVHFAHQRGILHRDLKPGNILLDAGKQPHVTDFGLAKRLDASGSLSRDGAVLGTASYMAPEQAAARDSRLTPAADVYSLGAILYELLTGRPPFRGETIMQTLWQVLDREPMQPRRLNPAVPRDLETICLYCLDKRPSQRFSSAAALADELERWVEGQPLRDARRVRWPERSWLWCRRKPVLASLSAAAVLLLALVAVLVPISIHRAGLAAEAKRDQDKAEREAIEQAKRAREAQEAKRRREYLNDMGAAGQAVRGSDFTEVRRLLQKWRPAATEGVDYRAWEWHFLDARCREVPLLVRGHPGQVQAVAWSPRGDRLASADGGGNVKIWDALDGKELLQLPTLALAGGALALAWSADGNSLAGAGQAPLGKAVVQIWDAASGTPSQPLETLGAVNRPLALPARPGEQDPPRHIFIGSWAMSLLWSPKGRKLALADADGKVQIWDVGTGQHVPIPNAHKGGVHSAAWSADGSLLASVGGDGVVRTWDPVTGKAVFTVPFRKADDFMAPAAMARSYALTWIQGEGGKRLSVVCNDGEIRVWDAATAKEVEDPPFHLIPLDLDAAGAGRLGSRGERFVWSPDGKRLASIQVGGVVKLWDPLSGKEEESVTVPAAKGLGPEVAMCAPAWDPTSRRLLLGGSDGLLQVYPAGGGRQAVRSPVSGALAWMSDSRSVLRIAFDDRPRIQVCDAITGRWVRSLGDESLPHVLAASPDWVASATWDGLLQLWPLAEDKPAVTLEKPTPTGQRPNGSVLLAWTLDGKRLAYSLPGQRAIYLWDPASRKTVLTHEAHGQPLRSLAWSRDGQRLASAGDDGTGKVWDVVTGRALASFDFVTLEPKGSMPRPGSPRMLAWSHDVRQLAVYGDDEVVKIRDVQADEWVATLHGHPSTQALHDVVCTVAWSPDGKRLASASPDGTFLLWDTATWTEVLTLSRAPTGPFGQGILQPGSGGTLAWSPDGNQLAFFGGGSVTIWDATPEAAERGQ
jgi:WD40 repeat protein/tRNA A-37 threonylcarbamoyl transferase component Bud32